jgi:hypothetical protein
LPLAFFAMGGNQGSRRCVVGGMTGYFDPDRWYRTERTILETRRESSELDDRRYSEALRDLDWRYDQIVSRIGNTFRGSR